MPFPRPTLTDLRLQAQQDVLNSGISGLDAFLRFSILGVVTFVQAGLSWLHYGYLDYISKESQPWTATGENLAGWGMLKNVPKKTASAASSPAGSWQVTGNNVIPSGTTLTRLDQWAYTTTADSTVVAGFAVAPFSSVLAGALGNAAVGTQLALGSPVPGVQTSGTMTQAATGGADIEIDANYSTRVIAAYQAAGSDGKLADYEGWATAVPGVTRAWVNPNGFGAGTVVVYVMFDIAEAATGGFPVGTNGAATGDARYATATGDQLTVANAILPDQSVTALVIVCAPIPQPIAFTVSDLGAGNTLANQALITTALQDCFVRVSAPGGTVTPDKWEGAIQAIPGLTQFAVPVPAGPVTGANAGAMPTLGAITFAA